MSTIWTFDIKEKGHILHRGKYYMKNFVNLQENTRKI